MVLMRTVILLSVGLMSVSFAAHSDVIDHTVTGTITGRCKQLVFAGARESCTFGSVQYRWGTRGRSIIVPQTDGREIVFMGTNDSRPKPEEYRITLTSVYFNGSQSVYLREDHDEGAMTITGPLGTVYEVVGQCRAHMSADGAIWQRLECRARDAAGARFGVTMTGDGQRTTFMLRGSSVEFPVTPENRGR